MNKSCTRLKAACYTTNLTMSVVGHVSSVLFITFHTLYGVSYSLLGLLVLINFTTQLAIDLIFSFFSHKFNIPLTVKLTPVIGAAGLILYACSPIFFPRSVYTGLVLGTLVFSASSGLAEVLISPVIAAIPAKDPDREMSKLHSIYAWGVVGVILISTLFLLLFPKTYWPVLPVLFASVPLLSAVLFVGTEIPPMDTPERASGALDLCRNRTLWLCVASIFLGGATECTMAQWSSGYLEQALHIPKLWGDIFGVALFALMLGTGRTLYAKMGKHIEHILLAGFGSAIVCYVVCALTPSPLPGLIACALTGFCTSMLWPGNLVVAAKHFPSGGVFIYAMMAAGGDLGASVGPQLVGVVTDLSIDTPWLAAMAQNLGFSPEQFGLKLGMMLIALFPVCGMITMRHFVRSVPEHT